MIISLGKKVIKTIMCLLLLVTVGCQLQQSQVSSPKTTQPNVVLILSDDQSWCDYGFMGHDIIQTPHLDTLASEGVLFERGYVPTALCRASLSTIATGHYASTHRIIGNDPKDKTNNNRQAMIDRANGFDTIAELLGEQGYLSHQSGKWWEGNYQAGGFTHGMTRGFPEPGGRHGDDGLRIGRDGIAPVTDFIDHAVAKDKPFFVWYAPFMPHSPHTPPKRLLDKYIAKVDSIHVAKYYAMVEWFDETCGDLLGYLDKKNVRDNTLVIYISDNGWIQDPHSKRFAFGSKQMPQEGGVRQPTIYSWPNTIKPARRNDLVSSIDILPTICAATGARTPDDLPGLNLFDAMVKNKTIERTKLFGESFAHDLIDLDNPYKTLLYRWVIQGQYKLILSYNGENQKYLFVHDQMDKQPQLYDVIKYPYEKHNLAKERPKKVAKLVKALDDWYQVTEVSCLKTYQ